MTDDQDSIKKPQTSEETGQLADQIEKTPQTIREESILEFWDKEKIFEKTLAKNSPKGEFVFFDGPPYATGMPHFGHLLPSTLKDAIPRYKTMQGYHVPRKWGWDCHGLPIENLIEKELNLKDKKAIIEYGIAKFNKAARDSVFRYDAEWKTIIHRIGRFVDMDNSYFTMDSSYTESVWWSFKELHNKGLVYEGFKSMHICPRCETTLSNFEVSQEYQDIQDISVYALFLLDSDDSEKSDGVGSKDMRSEGAGSENIQSNQSDDAGEIQTYILAWTTTPWTLHGNVALAVNPDLAYVKVKTVRPGTIDVINIIIAESRLEFIKTKNPEASFEIIESIKGSQLEGKSYTPIFDTYSKVGSVFPIQDQESRRVNAWKIYSADFVTADSGTGIVHIAPGYGDDDYKLSEKYNLPLIQHVGINGRARPELSDPYAGNLVKAAGDTQSYDILIIKALAHGGALYAKEKLNHSYPYCWRCKTPLLNFATSAWFVEVTKLQNRFIEENNKVNWVPESMGKGRFGSWLENLRDWNISRARFWGAPLPVWRGVDTGAITVIGSIAELGQYIPKRNSYTVMRHGESTANIEGVISSADLELHGLTEKGIGEVTASAKLLIENKKITKIYSSDFRRTRESAELLADQLGIPKDQIVFDVRLRECASGTSDGRPWSDHWKLFTDIHSKMFNRAPGGESVAEVKHRVSKFMYEIDATNTNEEILIVTHGLPLRMIAQTSLGKTSRDLVRTGWSDESDATASLHGIAWKSLPHNDLFELDIHRPYVDGVTWKHPETGEQMVRVQDVFDVWYDSGSMPFAQAHYPFENKAEFEKSGSGLFPADFISEGVDQTRGWFYSLLALGVGLFDKSPYKNVVVNGLIMAEDGRKMSKSLNNYPDLWPTIQKYGADSLRYFLASSPATHAEEVSLIEKSLDEVNKKVFNRLENIYSFLLMYTSGDETDEMYRLANEKLSKEEIETRLNAVSHPLDIWVLALLNKLTETVTESFDSYLIDKATRPIAEFIDEVSTWYLRRSRDRFKSDDVEDRLSAVFVTRFVLLHVSKLMAPVTPFISEYIYQKVKTTDMLSVHLESWPEVCVFGNGDASQIVDDMKLLRELVERGLALRSEAKIKVRQPLAEFVYTAETAFTEALEEIIKDELNVKKVTKGDSISLDTIVTEALKKEGSMREIVRAIQQERKNMNLVPQDSIDIVFDASAMHAEIIKEYFTMLENSVLARTIVFSKFTDVETGTPVAFEDGIVSFKIAV